MIESFVDLTYRGLPLGRRIKLTQVRPSTGYLELPAPMPVGTPVRIATDEGLAIDAVVTHVHEQVAGSDHVPGMTVRPGLADDAASSWWQARVAMPDAPVVAPAPVRATPAPAARSHAQTIPTPPPAEVLNGDATAIVEAVTAIENTEVVEVMVPEPDAKATMVMPAIDQETLEQLTRTSAPELETLTHRHAVVDDGKSTMVMEAIDPAALGLDAGASGSMSASGDDDPKPTGSTGTVKKRRKRR